MGVMVIVIVALSGNGLMAWRKEEKAIANSNDGLVQNVHECHQASLCDHKVVTITQFKLN